MIRKFLALSFICSSLFSKPNDPYELALYGSIPSAIVGGSVNVITGDYVINQEDYVIPAHEPLPIQRSYSTRNGKNLFGGWQYGFNHLIAWWDCHDGVLIPEKSGISLTYQVDRPTPSFKLQDFPGGLTNCFSGQIGARYDPTNNTVQIEEGYYDEIRAILVKGPDGSQRFYRYRKNWDSQEHARLIDTIYYTPLFLEWETLPNGTKTIEIYDAHENLFILEKQAPNGDLLLQEEFFYDLNSKLTKQISTLPSNKQIIKTWDYDCRGRLKKLAECPGEEHEKTTRYSYTLDGHLKQIIKPSGLKITYTYDGLGRKTSVQTSDETVHYELTYDDRG